MSALPPEGHQRAEHLAMLLIAAVAVTGSVLGHFDPRDRKVDWMGVRVPTICKLRAVFGVECAGCGLTRSFVAFGNGRWVDAVVCHRAGPLLFLLVAAQIPYRALALAWPAWERRWRARAALAWWVLGAALAYSTVEWLARWILWGPPR